MSKLGLPKTSRDLQGEAGEQLVRDVLQELGEGYSNYYNIRLPGETSNIDHVVVAPDRVYVIETKYWNVNLESCDGEWYWVEANGRKHAIDRTPIDQVLRNAQLLHDYLAEYTVNMSNSDLFVRPVIVLVRSFDPPRVQHCAAVDIVSLNGLADYFQQRAGEYDIDMEKVRWAIAEREWENRQEEEEVV